MTIEVALADDSRTATLTFTAESETWTVTASTAEVESVIFRLREARSKMKDSVPHEPNSATPLWIENNPRWFVKPDEKNQLTTLFLRNSATGWYRYDFPRNEAASISKWFRKISTNTRNEQSISATSFGTNTFKLTTDGLGVYYFGDGEN